MCGQRIHVSSVSPCRSHVYGEEGGDLDDLSSGKSACNRVRVNDTGTRDTSKWYLPNLTYDVSRVRRGDRRISRTSLEYPYLLSPISLYDLDGKPPVRN